MNDPHGNIVVFDTAAHCKREQAKTRSTLHPNSNGDQMRNKGAGLKMSDNPRGKLTETENQ